MRTSFPTVAFFVLILAGVWTVGATEPFAADHSTIGLWSFDSGEGATAVDVSRFHHNGTLFGTSERVEGRFGNGIVLASEDAKLSLQNPAPRPLQKALDALAEQTQHLRLPESR